MRKGSGKRRFACEHPGCDKVFNRKDYLERHAVNHLDVKPFNCKHCDRQFSREDLYENHLKSRLHIKRLRPLDDQELSRAAPVTKKLRETPSQASSSYLEPSHSSIYAPAASTETAPWLNDPTQQMELADPSVHGLAVDGLGGSTVVAPHLRQPGNTLGGPSVDTSLDAPLLPLRGTFGAGLGSVSEARPAGDRTVDHHGIYDDVFGSYYSQYGVSPADYALPNYGTGTVEGIGLLNGDDTLGVGADPSLEGYVPGTSGGKLHDASGFLQPPRYKMYANPLTKPKPAESPSNQSRNSIVNSIADYRSESHPSMSTGADTASSKTSTDATSIQTMDPIKPYLSPDVKTSGESTSVSNTDGASALQSPPIDVHRKNSARSSGTSSSRPLSQSNLPGLTASDGTGSNSTSGSDEEVYEPPAYKAVSYLLKTKRTSDKLLDDAEALDKVLREPAASTPESRDFEAKYRWFFDDDFSSSSAKYGYDRCYGQSASTYMQRAIRYRQEYGRRSFPRDTLPPDVSSLVLRILRDAPEGFFRDPKALDHYIYVAWSNSDILSTIVHRPSFDVVEANPALLATMVVLGMAMSPQPAAKEVARIVYPTVYLYTYEAIVKMAVRPQTDRFTAMSIGPLQAFCLLMRYEQSLLGKGFKKLALIHAPDSLAVVNRCIWTMLLTVPQLKIVAPNEKFPPQSRMRPVLATVSQEGYIFHQGADKEQQWIEWVAYEMAKRTAQLTLFCDSMYSLSLPLGQRRPVSIFNLDIHALSPDSLWDAQSQSEFFFVVGPTSVVNNVPFLGLMKSMIRFPRVASQQGRWKPRDLVSGSSEQRTAAAAWSRFSLRMVAYGLTNIVGRLSGLFNHGDMILQEVLARPTVSGEPGDLGPPVPTIEKWVSPFFDQRTQARLYRGLDVWFNHFEHVYGDVTQRLFKVAGIFGLRVDDEFGMLDQEDRGRRVPAYAFMVVLYHYSSFIFVHEDLPIVLQVTTNLHTWLAPDETTGQLIGHDQLLEYLYMPLYVQWAQTDEARAIVSTASLYLVWLDAATGQVPVKMSKYQLFSACVFVSVIVIWLHDLASVYLTSDGDLGDYESEPLSLDNYLFMDDAVMYLHGVYNRLETGDGAVPEKPQGSVRAVILMGACLLYLRPHTRPLVQILTWLLQVMDPRLSEEALQGVLDGAKSFYSHRQTPSGIL